MVYWTYKWGYFVNPSECGSSVNAGGYAEDLGSCYTNGVYCSCSDLDCPSISEVGVSITVEFDRTLQSGTKFSLRIKGSNEGAGDIRIFVCKGEECTYIDSISINGGEWDVNTEKYTAPCDFNKIVVEVRDSNGKYHTDHRVYSTHVACVIPNIEESSGGGGGGGGGSGGSGGGGSSGFGDFSQLMYNIQSFFNMIISLFMNILPLILMISMMVKLFGGFGRR